jgi:hypothetical protein
MNKKPTLKIGIQEKHIEAAAKALKALEDRVEPEDAQICVTLMIAYMTHRFQWDPTVQPKLIANNLRLLRGMGKLLNVLNSIHSKMIGGKIFIPKSMPPIITFN